MGHTYSGFTVKNRARFMDTVETARKAVALAWADIQDVRRRKRPSRLYARWFGKYSNERVKKVFDVINAINYAIGGGSITFERAQGSTDYAAAYRPRAGGASNRSNSSSIPAATRSRSAIRWPMSAPTSSSSSTTAHRPASTATCRPSSMRCRTCSAAPTTWSSPACRCTAGCRPTCWPGSIPTMR